jgi:hypothetical protein
MGKCFFSRQILPLNFYLCSFFSLADGDVLFSGFAPIRHNLFVMCNLVAVPEGFLCPDESVQPCRPGGELQSLSIPYLLCRNMNLKFLGVEIHCCTLVNFKLSLVYLQFAEKFFYRRLHGCQSGG